MKIIFLGTNGWYSSPTGNTVCTLIDAKERYIILDAGNGFYKIGDYIKEPKPIALFISHFHLDHVSGLHVLPKFTFSQGIDVFVAKGRKRDFDTLVHPPYTVGYEPNPENIISLPMAVRLHELAEGNHHTPFPITVIEQFHAYRDHGYRFQIEGKTIAYSGDCGISDGSKPLAQNADLLIHECALKKVAPNSNWGHTEPGQAAMLAKTAQVKQLVLTHFDPTQYQSLAERKAAEWKAKSIFTNTIIARDDMIITI